jgi:ABC-2 type transport system permease protein
MGTVYRLTLRQLSGRWRLVTMAGLACMPMLVAVLTLRGGDAPSVDEFEKLVFGAMLFGAITPLVVLAIATAAFANEIEDRTLANLTVAPIARWRIVVPKILAVITIAAPFVALSAFVTGQVAFLDDPLATFAVTTSSVVAVVLYASAFVWLGLVTPQAIGIGLLYIVIWEGFFSGFVAGVRLLSIRHYSIAVMHALDARRFAAGTQIGGAAVAITSVAVFAGFLFLAVRRLRRMDVP